jgi:hypothetical protein
MDLSAELGTPEQVRQTAGGKQRHGIMPPLQILEDLAIW